MALAAALGMADCPTVLEGPPGGDRFTGSPPPSTGHDLSCCPCVQLDLAPALHYDPLSTLEEQMGSLGVPELIIIFVVALIVFGPKKLPELGKSLGKGLAEFRRASNELKSTIEEEVRAIEAEPPARYSSEPEPESKSEPEPESKPDAKTTSETNLDAH